MFTSQVPAHTNDPRFEFYSLFFFFFPFPSLSYFQHGCYRRSRLKRPTLCSRSQRPPTSNKRNRRTRYNFHSRKRGRFARVRRCFPDFRLTSVEQRDSRVSSRIDLLIQSVPFHEIYSCSSPSLSNFDAISFEKKKKKERRKRRRTRNPEWEGGVIYTRSVGNASGNVVIMRE